MIKINNNNLIMAILSAYLILFFSSQVMALTAVEMQRVSVDSLGGEGNGSSKHLYFSPDGRYVVFESAAENLVAGDNNGFDDIFIHDRNTGLTEKVSGFGGQANGHSSFPSISADGRYVAFISDANNLVAGDTNDAGDVFVFDRDSGQTGRVSKNSSGVEGNFRSDSSPPLLSSDGRFVVFASYASNLVTGDTNGVRDVFVHERISGQTTRVSVNSQGEEGNGESVYYAFSADNRYIAFSSAANNLVPEDTNATYDVFIHDLNNGETSRVSVDSLGVQGDGFSYWPSLSADGRYVAFSSRATNLVPGDTNGEHDVFVHDRNTGQTSRVSNNILNDKGMSTQPFLSADGRFVAFSSSLRFVYVSEVFVHDRNTGQTHRVTGGNKSSLSPSISADGHYLAFRSENKDLVTGDTNDTYDVFVTKLLNNEQDFDGDDKPDLLLRNYLHGKNQIWFMDNASKTGQVSLPTIADLNWRFEGMADFNSDGQPDLLLRNHDHGANQIWLMQGDSKIGQSSLPRIPDTNWAFEGAADFNGDQKPDIVLRNHLHGQNLVWYMDGVTKIGQASLPTIPDTDWYFEGVADFNNDKNPDLVLRNHRHGQNQIWYMNGTNRIGTVSLPTIPDISWSFQGATDFNADFAPDLLLRNYSHGANQIWYFQGSSKTGADPVAKIPDVNWRIENR